MFVKVSGGSFQSLTALYEKDCRPVADLKIGILSLLSVLVFLVWTWLLVVNLLHTEGGTNSFIHLNVIRVSLSSSCLATGNQ